RASTPIPPTSRSRCASIRSGGRRRTRAASRTSTRTRSSGMTSSPSADPDAAGQPVERGKREMRSERQATVQDDTAGRPARRAGRRPGDSGVAETILDVAEAEFAARGYEGTSLREITDKARVNQALVRYYFGSKEGLYRAVFLRRGEALTRERLRLLDELEARRRKPRLEEIVAAFLKPAMDLRR